MKKSLPISENSCIFATSNKEKQTQKINVINNNKNIQKMITCEITLSYRKKRVECTNIPFVSSHEVYNYAKTLYSDDININESFFVILLNNANKVIGHAKIGQGSITQCVVDIRLIAKYAIEALATKVVLVHNHPSGIKSPSAQDKTLTTQINNALSLFDIKVLDHLILTDSEYYSFCDNDLIN